MKDYLKKILYLVILLFFSILVNQYYGFLGLYPLDSLIFFNSGLFIYIIYFYKLYSFINLNENQYLVYCLILLAIVFFVLSLNLKCFAILSNI